MATTWQALEDLLDPVILTVEAQAIDPLDTGETLLWDVFFPREDVPSVKLKTVTTVDRRFTADRREWNARGRTIPLVTPPRREVSIVPIESNFRIDEEEMQALEEAAGGNAAVIRDLVGVSLPKRRDSLVMANYRRLEVDAFKAWATGTIVQKNPETGATYTASFGFPAARYTTESPAWDATTAYDKLLAWIADTEAQVGDIEGVVLRSATLAAILADAPNLANSVKMTRSMLEDRVADDRGGKAFSFFLVENTVEVFNDGGSATTSTKLWPAQTIAAIPVGRQIGKTAFAPVVRAAQVSRDAPADAGIDVRGVTVYSEVRNGGRELMVEAQLNALPIPNEQKLKVSNVGI
jgi:hypothetical protein